MEITDYEITPFLFTEENVIQKLNEMSVECRLTLLELIHLTFRKEDEDEEPVVECKEDEDEENLIQKLNEMSVECRLTLLELILLTFRKEDEDEEPVVECKEDEDEEPVVECKEDERTTFKNMAYALLGEETCVPMSLKYARCLKWTTYMCPYESQVRKMLEMDNFYLPCDLELTKDS